MGLGQGVAPDAVIEASSLSRRFGGLLAVEDYALTLRPADVVGLIGPNGAGKTTAFNLLSGVIRPDTGRVLVCGQDMTGARPHRFARAGVGRTFQNSRLFEDLPVLANVMAGAHARLGAGLAATLLRLPSFRRAEAAIGTQARGILARLGLGRLADLRAGDLSYGDQRRVEIARALAAHPRALLLDEPAAGLNPAETDALRDTVARIAGELGIAVLVVEHDMRFVMGLCRRVQVLNRGRLIAEGTPAEVQADAGVVEAYLGSRRAHAASA